MGRQAPRVELEIKGWPNRDELIPLRTLAQATESVTQLLLQIAADRPEHGKADWFVKRPSTDRAILAVQGREAAGTERGAAREILQATMKAPAILEAGGEVRSLLSYPALEQVHALANLRNDGASFIIVRGFDREIPITTIAAERAKELLARRYYSAGSVGCGRW